MNECPAAAKDNSPALALDAAAKPGMAKGQLTVGQNKLRRQMGHKAGGRIHWRREMQNWECPAGKPGRIWAMKVKG